MEAHAKVGRSGRALGFTLIELMIVVAIVGVLAAIAIPQYQQFAYRAKQAESLTIIGMAKNAEYTHFAHYDCFVSLVASPSGGPAGVLKAAWDSVQTGVMDACPGGGTEKSFEDLFVRPHHPLVFYQYDCAARYAVPGTSVTDDFTCSAWGDIDGDGMFYELLYGTDQDEGMSEPGSIPSATPAMTSSFFPNDPVRVSPGIF